MKKENVITNIDDRIVISSEKPHRKRVLIEIKNLVNENYPDKENPSYIWHSNHVGLTKKELEDILKKTKWN
jgi:hypothetical protein